MAIKDMLLSAGTVITVEFPSGHWVADIIQEVNHKQLEEIIEDCYAVDLCFETGCNLMD